MHFQVAFFPLYWSMLTYDWRLKKIIKLIKNCRPISILSIVSKVYKRLFLVKSFQYCKIFRKNFNAEQCLINIIENWHKYLDTGGHSSALLTDVSITFVCNNRQLLITKLKVYGVETNSLYLLASYFEIRKQKIKVNIFCNNFNYAFSGVPQDSIIGPLL